jgi:hypothetical protein
VSDHLAEDPPRWYWWSPRWWWWLLTYDPKDWTERRGSDSLNPTPARTVDSATPDERAQSARYSTTDMDD